jgi:arylformamidase
MVSIKGRDLVYRGYTQAELDIQYDQGSLVPDLAPYQAHWVETSEAARRDYECVQDIAYGAGEREKLDLYRPAEPRGPIVVMIHGGAWRRLSKDRAAFSAPVLLDAGAGFVALGFDLIDQVPLAEMVRQVRAGVAWVFQNASEYGFDPERLFVHGFSSGAHLAANVLSDGWRADAGVPENLLKGAVLCSGPYDLEPVTLSARSEFLKLDAAGAKALTPNLHIPPNGPPIVVAWGDGELAEFRRQGAAFADAWTRAGNPVETIKLMGANHFDACLTFADPEGPLAAAALSQMGLD